MRVCGVKGMEMMDMEGIGGGMRGRVMDGIVENEVGVGSDVGIIWGVEVWVGDVVVVDGDESGVIVCV